MWPAAAEISIGRLFRVGLWKIFARFSNVKQNSAKVLEIKKYFVRQPKEHAARNIIVTFRPFRIETTLCKSQQSSPLRRRIIILYPRGDDPGCFFAFNVGSFVENFSFFFPRDAVPEGRLSLPRNHTLCTHVAAALHQ